ncbi:hypothetical protein [Brumicola pallidula]|nr:hypothetical protein [Glaciecola pallidula]
MCFFNPIDFIGKLAALIPPPMRAPPNEQCIKDATIQHDFSFGA